VCTVAAARADRRDGHRRFHEAELAAIAHGN
jgi:hypothetical protein